MMTTPTLADRIVERWGSWRVICSLLAAAVILTVAVAVAAADGSATTTDDATTSREIASSLRCPSCPGQAVVDSDAPAAVAIRTQIDVWVRSGVDDSTIRSRLAERYGDSILLVPRSTGAGLILHVAPIAVAIAAAGILGATSATARHRRRPRATSSDQRLVTAVRRQRLTES